MRTTGFAVILIFLMLAACSGRGFDQVASGAAGMASQAGASGSAGSGASGGTAGAGGGTGGSQAGAGGSGAAPPSCAPEDALDPSKLPTSLDWTEFMFELSGKCMKCFGVCDTFELEYPWAVWAPLWIESDYVRILVDWKNQPANNYVTVYSGICGGETQCTINVMFEASIEARTIPSGDGYTFQVEKVLNSISASSVNCTIAPTNWYIAAQTSASEDVAALFDGIYLPCP